MTKAIITTDLDQVLNQQSQDSYYEPSAPMSLPAKQWNLDAFDAIQFDTKEGWGPPTYKLPKSPQAAKDNQYYRYKKSIEAMSRPHNIQLNWREKKGTPRREINKRPVGRPVFKDIKDRKGIVYRI